MCDVECGWLFYCVVLFRIVCIRLFYLREIKMAKYHINPDGEAKVCSATVCPFGSDTIHGESVSEVRRLYEDKQKSVLFPVQKKESNGDVDNPPYLVPMHMLDEARATIDKANRRLSRQGISEQFEVTEEVYNQISADRYGNEVSRQFMKFHLNSPSFSYKGYDFLAVVDREDGGLVTRTGRGVELDGWRPEDQACDHCGQARHRSKTYLVKGPDGERHQIGSTCVESYLGIKPEGLWALGLNPLEKKFDDDEEFKKYFNSGPVQRPVDYTLAMALAVSDNGERFISRSYAMDNEISSTSDILGSAIEGLNSSDDKWRDEMNAKAKEYIENGRVAEIKKVIEDMDGNSDYAVNLKTIASGEWVSPRASNTLISVLAVERKKKQQETNNAKWTSGYAAPIGEPMKGKTVKIVENRVSEVVDNYNYGGTKLKSQIIMQDENGHQLMWWASRKIHVDEGTEVELTSGKVTKHSNFRGIDQTVLQRVKMPEYDPYSKERLAQSAARLKENEEQEDY